MLEDRALNWVAEDGEGGVVEVQSALVSRKPLRQMPKELAKRHGTVTQAPALRTWPDAQLVHEAPDVQVEQPSLQGSHFDPTAYMPCGQEGKQRPSRSSGRSRGQVRHFEPPAPEHVAQSGLHCVHFPSATNVLPGHSSVQTPFRAEPDAQVKQKSALPAHVLHFESHAA